MKSAMIYFVIFMIVITLVVIVLLSCSTSSVLSVEKFLVRRIPPPRRPPPQLSVPKVLREVSCQLDPLQTHCATKCINNNDCVDGKVCGKPFENVPGDNFCHISGNGLGRTRWVTNNNSEEKQVMVFNDDGTRVNFVGIHGLNVKLPSTTGAVEDVWNVHRVQWKQPNLLDASIYKWNPNEDSKEFKVYYTFSPPELRFNDSYGNKIYKMVPYYAPWPARTPRPTMNTQGREKQEFVDICSGWQNDLQKLLDWKASNPGEYQGNKKRVDEREKELIEGRNIACDGLDIYDSWEKVYNQPANHK